MNELRFDEDIRHEDPNDTAHRKARFREGWRDAATGPPYGEDALKQLTWQNLGYRLGVLFPDTRPELVDKLYDWCVRQQQERRQS